MVICLQDGLHPCADNNKKMAPLSNGMTNYRSTKLDFSNIMFYNFSP